MESHSRYTISYRSIEVRQVMDWVRSGQCGCLIGLRGVGKSGFLHFIIREDVRLHYLGRKLDSYLFINLDFLSLPELSSWSVYELIVRRLADKIHSRVENAVAETVTKLQQEVQRSGDIHSAQRALEAIANIWCERPDHRLVFVFDEFGEVFRSLSPHFFLHLRSLRDAHKEQLSYIVITSHDLARLRSDLTDVEHFYRLVSRNLCRLGPYRKTDARQMIRHLAVQRSRELQEAEVTRLLEMSGGHAGLLKAILLWLWETSRTGKLSDLEPDIQQVSGVQRECQKIWESLSGDEQVSLSRLVNEQPVSSQAVEQLRLRGILRKGLDSSIFSPVFATFIQRQIPLPAPGTYIERSPRVVQLDGRRIDTLTELEFEVLYYLYEQHGRLCTKNELAENVYRQRYTNMQGGVSDESLQALISRLREKIEPDRAHPRYIITVRGEGYRFIEPDHP